MKKYMSILTVVLLAFVLAGIARSHGDQEKQQIPGDKKADRRIQKAELQAGSGLWLAQNLSDKEKNGLLDAFTIEEHEVYSFLQGPKSWEEGIPWSGEWCQLGVKGNSFGNFGCGLCCMANIYNTLTGYEVSPWDMCEYAMTASGYYPTKKAGAIDWGNMKVTLKACGISCDLYYKPDSYKKFQRQMTESKSAVVLISSNDDDTYWKDTPGHYVNIWLYEKENDTVFLAEPGNPEHNRDRVPLRYIYDALKTTSKFQYLAVDGYSKEKNLWKADGIDENWNRP